MDDVPDEVASELINLADFDLADLEKLDNRVLATALQGIRDELEHPEEAVAGFQSSL